MIEAPIAVRSRDGMAEHDPEREGDDERDPERGAGEFELLDVFSRGSPDDRR